MTTDVTTTQADSADTLAVLPPAQPMQSSSVAQLREHAQNMSTAYELAEAMCGTQLVPAIYRGKPQDGAAAILYGAELGLTPIQSLQQIFVVHGAPGIYARTMAALLKRRGYKIWTESTSDEAVTVMGSAPDGTAEASTWTIERAEKAGYTSNNKYKTDPQAMLYAKAVTEVCRKLAPEVLLGIATEDEVIEDDPAPIKVRNESQAPGVEELRARLGIAAAPKPAQPSPVAEDSPEQAAEAETNAPSKDALARLNALFARAGLGGKSAADKAKKKTVTEVLLNRSVDELTADDVEHVLSQLDQLAAESANTGEDLLTSTITEILEEKAAQK